jgi:hypothetical protein
MRRPRHLTQAKIPPAIRKFLIAIGQIQQIPPERQLMTGAHGFFPIDDAPAFWKSD